MKWVSAASQVLTLKEISFPAHDLMKKAISPRAVTELDTANVRPGLTDHKEK